MILLVYSSHQVARWIIGKLVREKQTCLSGTVLFNKSSSKRAGGTGGSGGGGNVTQCVTYEDTDTPHIQMHWKVPMASVSGLAVAGEDAESAVNAQSHWMLSLLCGGSNLSVTDLSFSSLCVCICDEQHWSS